MKILHVTYYGQKMGGAEVILFRTLEALEETGIQNVLVYQFPSPEAETRWPAYQVDGLGDPDGSNPLDTAKHFEEILQKEKPDLIHLYDIGNSFTAEISLASAPTVQSIFNHNAYCPGGNKFLPFAGKICERSYGPGCLTSAFLTHCCTIRPDKLYRSYRRSSQMMKRGNIPFLVLSRYQKNALIQNGFPENQIIIHPPFTPVPEKNNSPDQFKNEILFTGRINSQKGWQPLLEALRLLRSDYTLVVDGDGPDLSKMKERAVQLGIIGKIKFVGWQDSRSHEENYRRSSMAVVPSVWAEPFGMVGIEAFSHQKPVVAFEVGGIPDWLENGSSGFLIRPYDIKQMSEKIDELLSSPEKAKQMGAKGRARVEMEFTKEIYIKRLINIYETAVRQWQKP